MEIRPSPFHLPSRQPYGLMQLGLQQSLWRQLHQILGHPDLAPVELQQLYLLSVLLAAQDQADGRLLASPALILVQPAQVELHLALVGSIEAAQLQLQGHQAAQAAVIEEQVEVEVLVADGHALLASDEGEVRAQLQQEPLQLPQYGRLKIVLAVGVLQPQEVQQIRVPEDQIGRHEVRLLQGLQLLSGQLLRLARYGRALVEHALDLLAQRSHAPALHPGHLGVELALQRVLEVDYLDKVGPGQQSRQCLDYLGITEDLGKTDHVKYIAAAEALSILGGQPTAQQLGGIQQGDEERSLLQDLPQGLGPLERQVILRATPHFDELLFISLDRRQEDHDKLLFSKIRIYVQATVLVQPPILYLLNFPFSTIRQQLSQLHTIYKSNHYYNILSGRHKYQQWM